MTTIAIEVDLCGGLELIFDNINHMNISLESSEKWTIKTLIKYMLENYKITREKEMFVHDDSVTPGILVLVNETDWELIGQKDYQLQPNDKITFISTLHGG